MSGLAQVIFCLYHCKLVLDFIPNNCIPAEHINMTPKKQYLKFKFTISKQFK